MPAKYNLAKSSKDSTDDDSGNESDYQSEGETIYFPEKILGEGKFSRAVLFESKESGSRVIEYPRPDDDVDFQDAQAKYAFFKALYPDQDVQLFQFEDTYRLVLPLIPGRSYDDYAAVKTLKQQTKIFLAAVKSLQDCHHKGYVVIDLKADNIFYDSKSQQSYLIDGGLSALEGALINDMFCVSNENAKLYRKQYKFYAPECFSISRMRAAKSMDIYSLGFMIADLWENKLHPQLASLTQACVAQDPTIRPTLESLEASLTQILQEIDPKQVIQKRLEDIKNLKEKLPRPMTEETMVAWLAACRSTLDQFIQKITQAKIPNEDYRELDVIIEKTITSKLREIEDCYQQRLKSLEIISAMKFDEHYGNFIKKIAEFAVEKAQCYDDATAVARTLCDELSAAKENFLYSEKDMGQAKEALKTSCITAIKTASPVLEHHRQWRGAIAKFIIDLLSVITRGYIHQWGLFAPITETAKEMNNLAMDLSHAIAVN